MCERCGNPNCKGTEDFDMSIQNTTKFIDEYKYLCQFSRQGKVHPVLNQIVHIFLAVMMQNIREDDPTLLKEFYEVCFDFVEKHRAKLGLDE